MKFFKGKEDTHVKKIRAVSAQFIGPEHYEVDVEFVNESGEKLTLHLTPKQARALCRELGHAYEAINPPLNRGQHYSQWQGME